MDYTDFDASVDGKKKKGPSKLLTEGKSGYWWKEEDAGYRAQCLQAAAAELESDQQDRHNLNLLNARLYGNFDFQSFGARQYQRGNISAGSRVAFNVIQAAVDTLAAKISKHRPRPQFNTDGATWAEQKKAKQQGRFVEGMFSHAKVYKKDDLVFLDGGVFGDGGYKVVMDDDGKVNVERAFVDEILVDEADAKYGKPRQMIQSLLCHKEKLAAKYPEFADQIYAAKSPSGVEKSGFGDMVQVYEGWHLRSSKSSHDGYHSVVLDGGDQGALELLGEEWKMDRFPFVFFGFAPRLIGFWSQGVAEMLMGIQLELNRLVQSISKQLQRKGRGRIFLPLASKIPPEHLTNGIADVVYFNGNVAPVVDNQNAVAQEEFAQIDRLYQKAFQIVGVSELSVSAKKPSGLDAGVALREYEEIESERFAKQHQRWDEFHIELAETMLDFVREFGGEDYVTKYEHKRYMETIEWKNVKCERGEYAITMVPASSLPQTPGARRQTIKEMLADGFIDLDTALALMNMPDIEAETNLAVSARDDVDAMIARVLDEDGEVEMPDKYTDLELLVKRGTAAYLFAKNHKAPEDRLAKLSAMVDSAAAKMIAAQKAPPPAPVTPQAPGGPPPPGAGMTGMPPPVMQPPTPAVPPNIAP